MSTYHVCFKITVIEGTYIDDLILKLFFLLVVYRLQNKLKYGSLFTSSSDSSHHTITLEQLQEDVLVLEVTERQLRRRVDKLREQESLLIDKMKMLRLEHQQQPHENAVTGPYTTVLSGI